MQLRGRVRLPEEDRDEARGDERQDHVLSLDGKRRADKGEHRQRHQRPRACQADRVRVRGELEVGQQTLREADDVQGDRERQPKKQGDPDGPAQGQPEAAGDDVVGAPRAHRLVGGDGGDAEPRAQRDDVGHQDDRHRGRQPPLAHHPRQPQVHDHAEDRQDGRREDAAKGSELAVLGHRWARRRGRAASMIVSNARGRESIASPGPVQAREERMRPAGGRPGTGANGDVFSGTRRLRRIPGMLRAA